MPLTLSIVSPKPAGWRMLGAVLLSLSSLLVSDVQAQSDTTRWMLVAPSPQYEAGAIWRMFFGTDWRDLWTTPTKVEVLNLQTFAGGLTPMKQGGGQQTKSLRFQAGDGRQFNFRSVDKDPSAVLPPDLRGTFADDIVQDQISSAHPTGPLVSDRLLTTAGVPHPSPMLSAST